MQGFKTTTKGMENNDTTVREKDKSKKLPGKVIDSPFFFDNSTDFHRYPQHIAPSSCNGCLDFREELCIFPCYCRSQLNKWVLQRKNVFTFKWEERSATLIILQSTSFLPSNTFSILHLKVILPDSGLQSFPIQLHLYPFPFWTVAQTDPSQHGVGRHRSSLSPTC